MVLDFSGSTLRGGEGYIEVNGVLTPPPTWPVIVQSAKNVIGSENFKDFTLGIVPIGNFKEDSIPDRMYDLVVPQNANLLNESLDNISSVGDDTTNLKAALENSKKMLDTAADTSTASKSIIIISDGSDKENSYFNSAYSTAKNIADNGYNIIFIHINSTVEGQVDQAGNYKAAEFMEEIGMPEKNYISQISQIDDVNITDSEIPEEEQEQEEIDDSENFTRFEIFELNPNHPITRNINVSGSITGYNDVTPKSGSERILATTNTEKSILTVWRYGLGRVVVLSTDNGKPNGWSNNLFHKTTNLTSSAINWAIGNPRAETGQVIEAPDGWFGRPIEIEYTNYNESPPILKLDGERIPISFVGNNVYEAVVEPDTIGVHNLSGYPIAVNYGLEYRDVGLNEDFPLMIRQYGGKIYDSEQTARANLLVDARENSQKLVRESVSQKIWFLLAALVLFLGEVILRRIREIQEMKRMQSQIQE